MSREYLGDAVYVEHDGDALLLVTSNGIEDTNEIYLEPPVYEALVRYVDRLRAHAAPSSGDTGEPK